MVSECAREQAYGFEWAHIVKIGFPKVCQADLIIETQSNYLLAEYRHNKHSDTRRTGAA
jgi:hypothetical protein